MSQEGANMFQGGHDNHDIAATINNTTLPEITANSDSGKIGGGSMTASPADVPVVDIKGKAVVVGEEQEAGGDDGDGIFLSSAGADDHKDVVAGGGDGSGQGGAGKSTAEAEHEMHIWTERERRKKMKCLFTDLHALLPDLPAKADKASIVGEAANYIKTLQATYHKLQMRKLDRLRAQLGADVASTSALPSASQPQLPTAPPTATRESVLADMAHVWNSQQAPVPAPTVPTAPPAFHQTWYAPNIVLSTAGEDAYISVCMPRQKGILQTVLFVLEKHRIEVVTVQISSDPSRTMFTIQAHAEGPSSQSSERLMPEDRFKLAVSEMRLWLSN